MTHYTPYTVTNVEIIPSILNEEQQALATVLARRMAEEIDRAFALPFGMVAPKPTTLVLDAKQTRDNFWETMT